MRLIIPREGDDEAVDWLADLDPELRDRVKRTPTPAWIQPMNATLTDARFDDPEWIFERKLDGSSGL